MRYLKHLRVLLREGGVGGWSGAEGLRKPLLEGFDSERLLVPPGPALAPNCTQKPAGRK